MNNPTCASPKVFPMRLAAWLPACYRSYLFWLRHLLERLGRGLALDIWQEASQGAEDDLLRQILAHGWQPGTGAEAAGGALLADDAVEAWVAQVFPAAVQETPPHEARRLVEQMPPFPQIRRAALPLGAWKDLTAFDALHLRFHGAARLAEGLIRRCGKQGELLAYDLVLADRLRAGGGKTGSVAEFMADFVEPPKEPNLFSAGLEMDLLHAAQQAAVLNVTACAWAQYFRAHHPQVGYLMACSTDEAAYRAFNPSLRLQRTQTLMEGAALCDFRVYCV